MRSTYKKPFYNNTLSHTQLILWSYPMKLSRGAVRSVASSYAAVRMVAGSRPVLVIVWEWHIGLALLCGCSGALEYPTTNSCGPINKSLSLSLSYPSQSRKGSKKLTLVYCDQLVTVKAAAVCTGVVRGVRLRLTQFGGKGDRPT